jgi:hypothetical protein
VVRAVSVVGEKERVDVIGKGRLKQEMVNVEEPVRSGTAVASSCIATNMTRLARDASASLRGLLWVLA